MSTKDSKKTLLDSEAKKDLLRPEAKEDVGRDSFDKEISSDSYNIDEPEQLEMLQGILDGMIRRIDKELEKGESLELDPLIKELRLFVRLQETQITSESKLVETLREAFTRYITTKGIPFLKEYASICQDGKFDDYVIPIKNKYTEHFTQPEMPPMAAEDLINIDKWVENNCRWNVLKKINSEKGGELKVKRKPPPKFEVGQIVGAKDKERKWWMARILYVFIDPDYPYPWYYVHFEGWRDVHNEWISSPFRIKKFNPRRDFLKR